MSLRLLARRHLSILSANLASWRLHGFYYIDESVGFVARSSKPKSEWEWIESEPWETMVVPCGTDITELQVSGYIFDDENVFEGLVSGGVGWANALLIFKDRRLVHASQYSSSVQNPIIPTYLRRDVRRGDCIVIGPCHTAPSARGLGLYPAALARLVAEHIQKHGAYVMIMTRRSNASSARGILNAGFEPWRENRNVRYGPLSRDYAQPFTDPFQFE